MAQQANDETEGKIEGTIRSANEFIKWDEKQVNTSESTIHCQMTKNVLFISGHLIVRSPSKDGYIKIGDFCDKDCWPKQRTVTLHPLKGVWGEARVDWSNEDGSISIKPKQNIWLNVSIPIEKENGALSWAADVKSTSKISVTKVNHIVHISGHIDFNKQENGNYVKIAKLEKQFCPIVQSINLVPLKGVWGQARFEFKPNGDVTLKPKKNIWVNVSFPTQ